MTINVLVSSNLPYFIQLMCVLGSDYYELYPMEKIMCSMVLSLAMESG